MTADTPQLVLLRHGETQWSRDRKHTGRTDLPLTSDGEAQAVAAGRFVMHLPALGGRRFAQVRTSPLLRARRTAELAGFPDALVDADLMEWDYGPVEGRTSDEMSAEAGVEWQIFRDGVHTGSAAGSAAGSAGHDAVTGTSVGETLADVAARATRVIEAVTPVLDDGGDVLLIAHGHLLRVLGALWLDLDPTFGARLQLGTAAVCVLGAEHGQRTINGWNLVLS